jgi:inosine/xanthosine triphosphatase
MLIAIGSTNPVKCNAVQAVLESLFPGADYTCVDVPSGVAAQPWGDVETRTGALNRARGARTSTRADLGVGLEGGVQESEFGLLTTAWCALIDAEGRVGVGGNSCVMLPDQVAADVRAGRELGAAMDRLVARHNTKHQNGAIGILTNDLETRQSAYETLIRMALARFLHSDWYAFSTSPTGSSATQSGG